MIIVLITFICINRILYKLRDTPALSSGFTGPHHYFWLLVCQATVPTACSMAPPIVQMLLVFTEFKTPYWLSGFCSYCERESFYDKYLKQRGYNKDISPMELTGRPITVQLQVPFQILVDMDDSRQKAQMLLYVSMEWTDERLSFNETEYGFPRAMLPVSLVWVPNIVIYNSLSVEYTTVDEYSLVINSTGSALIYLYATYELFCPVDVQYFPFDTQYCSIDFETGGYAMDMMLLNFVVDDYELFGNPEWDYLGVTVRNNTMKTNYGMKQYTGCVGKFKRNSEFYVVFLIIPTSIMAIVIFIAILLPLGMNIGEKINFGLAGFLGLLFMLTIVVNEVPRTSHFPLITLWMLVQLLLSFLALISLAPLALIKKCLAKRKFTCCRCEWNEALELCNFCLFLIADGTFSYIYLTQVPENIPYVPTYI
ncbi:unnamed protein product [Auanema sp. JU1783]|nr:unnamed protein product [Auanema sp. JU1783]